MEYDSKHDMELPRAPAFQCRRSGEVENIVSRLLMAPKDRFDFVHTSKKTMYNDWKTAHEEKIRRLRETVHMFGGNQSHRKSKNVPEMTEENPERKAKSRKKKKRNKKDNIEHLDTLPEIGESNV